MRVMWCSNFSAQSAYASQSRLFVPKIAQSGHPVTVFELSSGVARPYDWQGIPIIGVGQDALGNDMIKDYVAQHQIDAVITLVDVWRFNVDVWRDVPFFPWTPIDHHPIPPHVMPPMKAARRVIAMSKFGRDEMIASNLNPLYCPLAFDPEIFHPRDNSKRGEIRRALNIGDDTFLACFVGVNDSTPNRKGIPEMLMAWKLFVQEHPNSVLYLHTLIHGNLPMNSIGGVKIDTLVAELSIPGHSLRIVDQHRYKAGIISQSEVADIMGASDVQVLLSRGEGFGVPLVEAQAVGTPVLTTRFAAQQELVQAGWLVDYESEWGWQDAVVAKAGVMDAVEKFEMAYNARGNMALRKAAAAGIQGYAIDTVMRTHMLPTLDRIAENVIERLAA